MRAAGRRRYSVQKNLEESYYVRNNEMRDDGQGQDEVMLSRRLEAQREAHRQNAVARDSANSHDMLDRAHPISSHLSYAMMLLSNVDLEIMANIFPVMFVGSISISMITCSLVRGRRQ